MTRFRKHCLIIALVCFGIIALVLKANADTTVYTAISTDTLGYDIGAGVGFDTDYRRGHFGAAGNASWYNRKKHDAAIGHTWSFGASARLFPYQNWYLGAGYGVYGYRSVFESGRTWEKSAGTPTFSIGYDDNLYEYGLTYFLRENDTSNRSAHINLKMSLPIYERWRALGGLGVSRYDQNGSRETGWSGNIGIGYGF